MPISGKIAAGPQTPGMRRGGRAVECTGLENRRSLTGTVGSNPTLSAIVRITASAFLDEWGILIA
jgi:hypothetical protein